MPVPVVVTGTCEGPGTGEVGTGSGCNKGLGSEAVNMCHQPVDRQHPLHRQHQSCCEGGMHPEGNLGHVEGF